jgi:hypothetical protein
MKKKTFIVNPHEDMYKLVQWAVATSGDTFMKWFETEGAKQFELYLAKQNERITSEQLKDWVVEIEDNIKQNETPEVESNNSFGTKHKEGDPIGSEMTKAKPQDNIELKSVEELKDKMGSAYNDLSVQVAYKEGYNRALKDVSTVQDNVVLKINKIVDAIYFYGKSNTGEKKLIDYAEELVSLSKVLPHLKDDNKIRREAVREIEDGLYENINNFGDLLFDVLEESKVGGFGKDVIRKNQENYDVFREVETRIRSYFKTLGGHIPSVEEYLKKEDL